MRIVLPSHIGPLTVLAAALGLPGCSDADRGQVDLAPAANKSIDAAALRLVDLDGEPAGLWSDAEAQVAVAVFTRSDCPISNRYAPEVRRLYEQYERQGVAFYLIYVDPREQPDAIRSHLAEYDYPCPALRDPEHTLVAATGATVTPEAVVFDKQWNVVYRGRIDDLYADLGEARPAATTSDLAGAIEATLAGRSVEEPITTAVGCRIEDLK